MDKIEEILRPIPELTIDEFLLFIKKVKREGSCWIWQACCLSGYGTFSIKRRTYYAHRVSWRWFKKEDPGQIRILHTCNIRACVNPEHLYLGTQSANMFQKFADGYSTKGELHRRAKLRDCDVIEIRRLSDAGFNSRQINKKFDWVSHRCIRGVIDGSRWSHIK